MEFSECFSSLNHCNDVVRGVLSFIPCCAMVYTDISDDSDYVIGLYLGMREVKEEVIAWINRVMESEEMGLEVKITGYTRVADACSRSLTVRLIIGNHNYERKFIPVHGSVSVSTKDWAWLAKRINKGKTLIKRNGVDK